MTVTVAAGGAVLGTVAMVSGSALAGPAPSASPVVAVAAAPAHDALPSGLVLTASPAGSPVPVGSPASLPVPAASATTPDVGATAPAPSRSPIASSAPTRPLDPRSLDAGLSGGYRFVAHLDGLPGLMSLGDVVRGTVSDRDHFTLEFPDSSFITHYSRDGSTASAVVNGRVVAVTPGVETLGDISPEDLMPAGLWDQTVVPWESTLAASAAPGTYAASSGVLVSEARRLGIVASGWQLSASTDASGRLLTLAFSGSAWDQPFSLDLVVLYA
jgi:hypothetical protein